MKDIRRNVRDGLQVYPVGSLLRSPWTSFQPTSLATVFAKKCASCFHATAIATLHF